MNDGFRFEVARSAPRFTAAKSGADWGPEQT